MEDFRLPTDLSGLEQELAARAIPEPSPELRGRVMAAIRQETVESPAAGLAGIWRFAAAVAAVLVLLLNLSMSVTNRRVWDVRGQPQQQDVAAVARKLRQIVPELSEEEAFRVVNTMESGPRLVLMPYPRGRPDWRTPLE